MIRIISAFLIWLVAATPSFSFWHGGGAGFTNVGGVVANLQPAVSYMNVRPFVNWAQQAGRSFDNATSGTTSEFAAVNAGMLDSNGELIGGSAISAIKSVNVSFFSYPTGTQNFSMQFGPQSAMFTGTIAATTLTVTGSPAGSIRLYDQVNGPGVTALTTPTNIIGNASTNSGACSPACTGSGGTGTYALSQSSTVASPVTMTTITYWWTGLSMTIAWTGSGVTSVSPNGGGSVVGTGGSVPACTSSPCTLTWGYNPANFGLKFSFAAGAASPPTKIQIYQTQYATQMAACAAATQPTAAGYGQCFAPDWIAQMGPYGFKRNMDWMDTNLSSLTDISQLPDFNYTHLANQFACTGSGAVVNGSISGTTLTFTSAQTLSPGVIVKDTAGLVAANTLLTSGDNSTSTTTYTVNNSQTVPTPTASITTTSSSDVVTVGTPSATISPYMSITDGSSLISGGGGPTVILPYGTGGTTGVGGAGTYKLSRNSNAPGTATGTFSTRMYLSASTSWVGGSGKKGCGVHPVVMVALANLTNTNPWFVLPLSFTPASAGAVATYINANLKTTLRTAYEAGNEDWNGSIGISYYYGQASYTAKSGAGTNSLAGSGYIASQFFDAIRTAYGTSNRSRWYGMVSGQMVNNAAVPAAFLQGFAQWKTDNSSSFNTWDLFDFVAIAPYASDFQSSTTTPLSNMTTDSTACWSASSASATATISGTAVTLSGISGTVLPGMGMTGAGIPSNTYLNSGSGSSWVSNNSATVGPVAVTFAPCATQYQFFAQQYSKWLITGSNNYSYAGSGSITLDTFPVMFQSNALYALSQGLQLWNYEGLFQLVISGTAVSNATTADFFRNFKYDAGGNDPLYTPTKVFDGIVSQMQTAYGSYYSVYMPDSYPGTFGNWLYPTDTNPVITEIKAVNTQGPFVDPTPAATWSVSYTATDHNFGSGSSTTLTCPLTSTAAGLAIVVVNQTSGTIPTSVTIDSVAVGTADAKDTTNAWRPSIWSRSVSAGAHTVSITWGSGQSSRSCATMLVTGLRNSTVQSAATQGQNSVTINETKGSLIIGVAAATAASTMQSASTPSGRISGCPSACSNVNTVDLNATQNFVFSYWSPGPDFSSPIFNIRQNSGNGMTAAVYN